MLGSVSSKASSMFSCGKTSGLTDSLMPCDDAEHRFLLVNSVWGIIFGGEGEKKKGKNKYTWVRF